MSENSEAPDQRGEAAPSLLERIESPADLHGLDDDQLQQVAQEMRTYIIDTIGEIGGHFGANLGTCELSVALHSMLDSPRDKVLWDVGHQAYPHKILTGRRDRLSTIRQYEGLAPFCSIFESEHDIMGAGHASTSIGYAVGLKEAMRKGIGEDGKVVAVIGDGALTGGVAYEALHAAGGLQTPIVIVLNDNGMSISPNVGALSRYFNRVRLNPRLYHAREGVEDRLTKLPLGLGKRIEQLGPEIKSAIKAYWAPGLLFEELDLAYMGVIDGHDVADLREALHEAFEADRPVVVHIHTVKGKGFAAAEEGGLEGMEKWHAAKPKSIVGGAPAPKPKTVAVKESDSPESIAPERLEKPAPASAPPQYTEVFAEAMVAEARRDPRVIGITAAMAGGTGLQKLADEIPGQYYDVGIAEQNAVLLASGLALQGAKPVCAIYSTFLQRAYDQIIHDVALQSLDVTFAMDRAGLVGDDGPTHHGAFDVSYFRPIPNVVVMAPRDEAMLVHMLRTAIAHDGPAALRYPRGAAEGVGVPDQGEILPVGTGELLGRGAARGPARLRVRGAGGARRGTGARRRGSRGDGGGRSLREAPRHRARPSPGPGARTAGDDRGERPAGGLRLRRPRAARGRVHRSRRAAGSGAANRPARPLCHPRKARAAAQGGRPHRGGRRGPYSCRRAFVRGGTRLGGVGLVAEGPHRHREVGRRAAGLGSDHRQRVGESSDGVLKTLLGAQQAFVGGGPAAAACRRQASGAPPRSRAPRSAHARLLSSPLESAQPSAGELLVDRTLRGLDDAMADERLGVLPNQLAERRVDLGVDRRTRPGSTEREGRMPEGQPPDGGGAVGGDCDRTRVSPEVRGEEILLPPELIEHPQPPANDRFAADRAGLGADPGRVEATPHLPTPQAPA